MLAKEGTPCLLRRPCHFDVSVVHATATNRLPVLPRSMANRANFAVQSIIIIPYCRQRKARGKEKGRKGQ
jgi:hypothetical protein